MGKYTKKQLICFSVNVPLKYTIISQLVKVNNPYWYLPEISIRYDRAMFAKPPTMNTTSRMEENVVSLSMSVPSLEEVFIMSITLPIQNGTDRDTALDIAKKNTAPAINR